MKKTGILVGVLVAMVLVLSSAMAGNVFETIIRASFHWKATEHDFGKIAKAVPVEHTFTFTNSGSEPLVITEVKPSCGCTVAEYSKEPIPAGKSGFVKATYNAATAGKFNKTVTLKSNTEGNDVVLTIRGEVVE